MHDDLTERAESVTREREILAVPRFLYGVSERFRKQERSYRLVLAQTGRAVSPGISLYDAAGEVISVTGYDGVATIMGVAGEFEFEEEEQVCTGAFTGNEQGEDDLPTLVVSCS